MKFFFFIVSLQAYLGTRQIFSAPAVQSPTRGPFPLLSRETTTEMTAPERLFICEDVIKLHNFNDPNLAGKNNIQVL